MSNAVSNINVAEVFSVSEKLLDKDLVTKFTTPNYDRKSLTAGIVHIGVGGFHRSHQAMYVDELCDKYSETNWAISGVGIMPQDEVLSKELHSQDCLYSLTERSGHGDHCRIIGSIIDHTLGLKDPKKVFELIASESTKIISLTVTEGGYYIDEGTAQVDLTHAKVLNDINNSDSPQTVYGYLLSGLALRQSKNNLPVTIMCCDNIQHNGEVVKKAVLRVAEAKDAKLFEWIKTHVTFPNSMVDRITPVPREAEKKLVKDKFDLEDKCPVVSESFSQWVIEDNFIAGRPQLELVGAQFVSDVVPFERMKIRLLNASHSAMGYLGYLLGHRYIHEIAQSSEYRPYLLNFMDVEMTPLVGEVPGVDLNLYKKSLVERFSNADICDTALRICSGGSAKIPGFILPAIADAIKIDAPIRAMTCVVASWLKFCSAVDEQGNAIPIEDVMSERLIKVAQSAKADPKPYLEMRDLFGKLSDNTRFSDELGLLLKSLYDNGAKETLKLCSKS